MNVQEHLSDRSNTEDVQLFQSDSEVSEQSRMRQESSSEDEDAGLFNDGEEEKDQEGFGLQPFREIKGNEDDIVATVTEKVDGVIEKATRKMKT